MDGLRCFIEVDNRSAVDVGGLRRGTKSIHVKKPQFSEACLVLSVFAMVSNGVDTVPLSWHASTAEVGASSGIRLTMRA